jgi:fumarate reductase subunit C
VSGLALTVFMTLHMALLLSAMFGASTMDRLAQFLERNYLLQAVAPLLILLIFAHVVLAVRKLLNSSREQIALQIGYDPMALGHLDLRF